MELAGVSHQTEILLKKIYSMCLPTEIIFSEKKKKKTRLSKTNKNMHLLFTVNGNNKRFFLIIFTNKTY